MYHLVDKKIKPRLDQFTSLTFETVCRSYTKQGELGGLKFNKVGRWWSKDAEIDIVGLNDDDNTILLPRSSGASTRWGSISLPI